MTHESNDVQHPREFPCYTVANSLKQIVQKLQTYTNCDGHELLIGGVLAKALTYTFFSEVYSLLNS